jgi:bifunctional DNA-binding transcriptional regulator/antitoxin component of YhaV-PrlF toxin-antitoxin module
MRLEITTTLEPRGPAGAILLDDAQVAAVGGGAKAFPVAVTVNGGAPVPLRLARMGGENMIGFRKEVRAQLGLEIGDELHAIIERDDAPREITIPDELRQALDANPEAKQAFEKLAPSHRKEHARAVADAKRPETRQKRVEAVLRAVMQA